MFGKYVAGVSFADGAAQVAVLQIKSDGIKVRHLMEIQNGRGGELWFLQPFLSRGSRIIRKVDKVSVALDHSTVVLHTFPLDSSLNPTEQNEHIGWELGNFLPSYDRKDYIHDVHTLQTRSQDRIADTFVIAARRSDIFAIQKALAEKRFELLFADTNHYGAQYALLVNYPEVKTKTIGLVGVGRNRVDLGVLHRGRLIQYRYSLTESDDDTLDFLKTWLEGLDVVEIFLYGSGVSSELATNASSRLDARVSLLNPFKLLRVASGEFDKYTGQEHRFASAVGMALRKQ